MANYHLLENLGTENLGPERKVRTVHWKKVVFGAASTVRVDLECGHTYEIQLEPNTITRRTYRCAQCHSNNPH